MDVCKLGDWANVGQNGYGLLTMTDNATFTCGNALDIGDSGAGTGIVNVGGSATLTAHGGIWVANEQTSYGELNVTDHGKVYSTEVELEVPWSGTGHLNVGDGLTTSDAVVDCQQILLGWSASSLSGVINLKTGGTIKTNKIYTDSSPLQSIVNFDGGVLEAKSSDTVGNELIANNGTAVDFQLNVKEGGAKINTATYNVTIKGSLQNGTGGTTDGGLTVSGAGILKMQGVSTYTGATTLTATSTVKLAATEALPSTLDTNTFTGATGTTLDLNGFDQTIVPTVAGPNDAAIINSSGIDPVVTIRTPKTWAITYTGAISGTGTAVTKSGAGKATLTAANSYDGVTTVNAGTLELAAAAQVPVLAGAGANVNNEWTTLILDGASMATVRTELGLSYNNTPKWAAGAGKIYSTFCAGTSNSAPSERRLGYKLVGSDVQIMVTMPGDVDLDGDVDFADYNKVLADFNAGMTGAYWADGDFNYNGVVDFADYNTTLSYFNLGAAMVALPELGGPRGLAGVPEPGTLALLAGGLIGLLAYAWRKRK